MPVLNWIGKEAVVKHHKDVPFRLGCTSVGQGDLGYGILDFGFGGTRTILMRMTS